MYQFVGKIAFLTRFSVEKLSKTQYLFFFELIIRPSKWLTINVLALLYLCKTHPNRRA